MQKLVLFFIVILMISCCNENSNSRTETTGVLHRPALNVSDVLQNNKKQTLVYVECVIDVCECPAVIGPDFNSLYTFVNLVYPENDSLLNEMKGKEVWILNDEKFDNAKGVTFADQKCRFCNKKTKRFIGSLYYVENILIDRTTDHRFFGFLMIAVSPGWFSIVMPHHHSQ